MDLDLTKCDATTALTAPARRVHLAILTGFATTGRPPSRDEIAHAAGAVGIDVDVALTELDEIRAAYLFSPTPAPHRVSWAGGPTVHTMCAIDALGMSAMLDRPVTITSAEPTAVSGRHRALSWSTSTVIVRPVSDLTGALLDQHQALASGIAEFGTMMRPA